MIEIYDSRSVRSSSTAQQALNDLALRWDGWDHIVDDQDHIVDVQDLTDSTIVKEIWVSDHVYITLSTTSPPCIRVMHDLSATSTETSAEGLYKQFFIITTENGVMMRKAANSSTRSDNLYIAVGKTVDSNGTESNGVICKMAAGSSNKTRIVTDNANSVADAYDISAAGNAVYNTVVIPMYSLSGDEHFEDFLFIQACLSSDEGKVLLNDQKYYFYGAVAMPYT